PSSPLRASPSFPTRRSSDLLRGVLLGVRVEDAGAGLARAGQHDVVGGVRPVEQPGDDAVLTLVDRLGGGLAAHGAVHGLDGELADGKSTRLNSRHVEISYAV